ncbi:hypothetical protein ALP29_201394 [Pseudomonas syringae pv. avii]|uniref:Uncharacterized protein n=1 Tax=Pseudomonas syringae pv. avii TaxID=663959 RepID=A0A3M5TZK0_PSESX|nr:hypothetical protein ALP29_201394 [Pseudomonas syringae pv. avii]
MLKHGAQAFECRGLARQIDAQQIGHLPERNNDGSAQCETEHHRVRNEIHQRAEAHHPQQQLEDTGDKGQQQDQHDVVLAGRHGKRTDTGIQHDGNSRRRPADQVPGRTPQASDEHRDNGGVQTVLGRQPGDQRVSDGLRQGQNRTA